MRTSAPKATAAKTLSRLRRKLTLPSRLTMASTAQSPHAAHTGTPHEGLVLVTKGNCASGPTGCLLHKAIIGGDIVDLHDTQK